MKVLEGFIHTAPRPPSPSSRAGMQYARLRTTFMKLSMTLVLQPLSHELYKTAPSMAASQFNSGQGKGHPQLSLKNHSQTMSGWSGTTTPVGSAFGSGNQGFNNAWNKHVGSSSNSGQRNNTWNTGSTTSSSNPFGTGSQGFQNAWNTHCGNSCHQNASTWA